MTHRLFWIFWIAGSLLIAHLSAEIVVPVALHNMLGEADSVVVASTAWSNAPDGSGLIQLTITESLKGPLRAGERVTLPWPRERLLPPMRAWPGDSSHGMFFLKRTNGWQPLTFLRGGQPDLQWLFYFIPREPLPAEYRFGSALPLADRIFLLLSWADSRAPLLPSLLQGMLLRNRLNLDFTPGKRSALVTQRLSQLTESTAAHHQMSGIRTLIQQGDAGAIRKLGTEYQRFRSDARGWQEITRAVLVELPQAPGVTAALGSLAAANLSDAPLRAAAAGALARIHDREALPHLARLLDDHDPEIRAYAVGGLAMFANNVPIGQHHPAPGDWPFRTSATMDRSTMSPGAIARDPAKYIGFWKDWWRDNQAAAMAPGR